MIQKDSVLSMKSVTVPQYDKTNKMSCAHSEDSDEPVHLRSLISLFFLCAQWVAKDPSFFMWTAKTLIRLGGCAGCTESSLDAQVFLLVFS